MRRTEQREHILRVIFGKEFYPPEELDEQIDLYFEQTGIDDEKDRAYIGEKAKKIAAKVPELDKLINEHTTGWKTVRMNKADLSILRLAVYEMKMDEDVPVSVAINEAVELAKRYGGEDSPSFVNGVLARIIK